MARQKVADTTHQTKEAHVFNTLSPQDVGLGEPKYISPVGFSTWVRALLQNWRQGTVACKGRSDVAFSNRKPWKQKGTGRARAGSLRSPVWRKGGVVFGPQARVRTLKVSKKLKTNILHTLAYSQLEAGRVAYLDWMHEGDRPRTSAAYALLKNAKLNNDLITLFLPTNDVMSYASFANIPNVKILFYDQANAFDLVHSKHWVVLKKDIEHFKEMVGRWI